MTWAEFVWWTVAHHYRCNYPWMPKEYAGLLDGLRMVLIGVARRMHRPECEVFRTSPSRIVRGIAAIHAALVCIGHLAFSPFKCPMCGGPQQYMTHDFARRCLLCGKREPV